MNFLKRAVQDLLTDDGLIVLSRSCGYREVFSVYICNLLVIRSFCQILCFEDETDTSSCFHLKCRQFCVL